MYEDRYITPADGALTVFTDGASLQRPRRGGVGIRFVSTDRDGNETAWEMDEPGVQGAAWLVMAGFALAFTGQVPLAPGSPPGEYWDSIGGPED